MSTIDVFNQIFNAESIQFDTKSATVNDLYAQLSVDTATWALDIYEKELGNVTDHSKSYDDRRSVIKGKMRGSGKVDAALIKIVIDAWTNGQVQVTFDGKINIKFNGDFGIPSNLEDAKQAVEGIKPAHLAVVYDYHYDYRS